MAFIKIDTASKNPLKYPPSPVANSLRVAKPSGGNDWFVTLSRFLFHSNTLLRARLPRHEESKLKSTIFFSFRRKLLLFLDLIFFLQLTFNSYFFFFNQPNSTELQNKNSVTSPALLFIARSVVSCSTVRPKMVAVRSVAARRAQPWGGRSPGPFEPPPPHTAFGFVQYYYVFDSFQTPTRINSPFRDRISEPVSYHTPFGRARIKSAIEIETERKVKTINLN